MGLIDDCVSFFECDNLYDVLNVEKTATASQIKKAYRKASLLHHPDKVEESKKDETTRKFQVLAKVYHILNDEEKRTFYDETGTVDDESVFSADSSDPGFWIAFWRNLFPQITPQLIDTFMEKYQGSEEERDDLKFLYKKYKGDMNKISESLIGYSLENEDRITETLREMIEDGEIPSFPKFVNETARQKAARKKRLTKEVEEVAPDSLAQMIAERNTAREQSFNSMIASIEAKYGNKKATGRKKRKL